MVLQHRILYSCTENFLKSPTMVISLFGFVVKTWSLYNVLAVLSSLCRPGWP